MSDLCLGSLQLAGCEYSCGVSLSVTSRRTKQCFVMIRNCPEILCSLLVVCFVIFCYVVVSEYTQGYIVICGESIHVKTQIMCR